MANPAAYFGFRPSRHLSGGVVRAMERQILYSYGTKIYTGDPVKLANDGTIQKASAGNRILGIFAGCQWQDSDGSVRYSAVWTAPGATLNSVNAKALVYVDPNIIFAVRCDATNTMAQTYVGNIADHAAGTGNDTTGQSGAYLDTNTLNTSDAGFRVLGISQLADNEVGNYAIVEVQIREHELTADDPATPGI